MRHKNGSLRQLKMLQAKSIRKDKHKLFQLFKIINGQVPPYLQQLVPLRVQQIIARYPLRNSQNFSVPPSRTVTFSSSFLPTILWDWNALDQTIKDSPSLQSFKNRINGPTRFPPKHFEQQQVCSTSSTHATSFGV